jgi:DNA-binding SARP family transcriptional activator
MRIRLLGGFGVYVGVRPVPGRSWRLKKAATLIKLLALAEGHRLHREQAMEYLWPTLASRAASNNLRQAIYAARRALTSDSSDVTHYLPVRDGWLALSPEEPIWVDVEAFEEAARSARRVREPSAYRVAIELYAGELLPEDRYEAWAEERREALRQTHLALLIELAGLHEERGEWEPAITALGRVVEADPSHDEANVGLMRIYATDGKRRDVILQYQSLRRSLILMRGIGAGTPFVTENLIIDLRTSEEPEVQNVSGTNTIDWEGFAINEVDGGAGDDEITGNELANNLFGGSDEDTLFGRGGDDELHAMDGSPDDTVDCGEDLIGGPDHDFALHDPGDALKNCEVTSTQP